MYSPLSMKNRDRNTGIEAADRHTGIDRLEARISELEGLVEALEEIPDGEVVGVLEQAVALLAEVNDRLEAGLESTENEARELGELLQRVDFGPLDEALEKAQRPPEDPGRHG